jgi:hypothetical protein
MVIFYPQLELGSIHDDNSSSGGRYKYMLLADTTSINDDNAIVTEVIFPRGNYNIHTDHILGKVSGYFYILVYSVYNNIHKNNSTVIG